MVCFQTMAQRPKDEERQPGGGTGAELRPGWVQGEDREPSKSCCITPLLTWEEQRGAGPLALSPNLARLEVWAKDSCAGQGSRTIPHAGTGGWGGPHSCCQSPPKLCFPMSSSVPLVPSSTTPSLQVQLHRVCCSPLTVRAATGEF